MKLKVLALLLVIIVALAFWYRTYKPFSNSPEIFRFTGTIKDIDDSCNFDGECKIKVGDIWITTNLGGDPSPEMAKRRGPLGKIYLQNGQRATGLSKSYVNNDADVYVKRIDEVNATLYGDSEYYIKMLDYPLDDKGMNVNSGSFTCKEFRDKSKNYIPSEIIVKFKSGVLFSEAENFIESMRVKCTTNTDLFCYGISIKEKDAKERIENGDFVTLVVPEGFEARLLEKIQKDNFVEYAELNGCNNVVLF